MPKKSETNVKMRGYKLSDETDALIQSVADAIAAASNLKCSKTEAVRIAIEEKAATMGLKAPKKK